MYLNATVTTIKPCHLIHGVALPLQLTLWRGLWQQKIGIYIKVQLFHNWKGFFKPSGVKCSKLNAAPDTYMCDLVFLTAVNIKIRGVTPYRLVEKFILIFRRALLWRRLVFPKRLRLFTKLRGVAFRRTVIFRSSIHFESNVWGKTLLMRAEKGNWRKGEWLQWTARNRYG